MKHDRRYIWLDLVRGLSAIAVCAHHLRAALFVDYSEIESPGLLQKVFCLSTSLGHQAVMVFFVLSGFFVGGSVLQRRARFSWASYATARLTRLWIVLIPAFALTLVVDRINQGIDPKVFSGIYWPAWASGPVSQDSYSVGIVTLLGNLGFLQTIQVPVYGSNTPLWSLANEFWYYVLFPALGYSLGFCQPGKAFSRAVLGALALILIFLLPGKMMLGFVVWLLGVAVWLAPPVSSRALRLLWCGAGFSTLGGALIFSKADSLQSLVPLSPTIAVGLGFVPLAVGLVNLPAPRIGSNAFSRFSRAISEFSYSLYLFHFPVVLLISISVYKVNQMQCDVRGFAHFVFWMAVLLAGGAGFWWMFERRTNVLRAFVTKLTCRQKAEMPIR